jgi:fructuronate reductase
MHLLGAGVARPPYDRTSVGVGVVHFGPGAFHRAHQADAFDQVLAEDARWGVAGVGISSSSVADALRPQDGLYVLATRDWQTEYRVIGAVRELLTRADERRIIDLVAAPTTGLITTTVTEKGYTLDTQGRLDRTHPAVRADLAGQRSPTSLVGWLVAGLAERRRRGGGPVTIASCDNLAENGRKLGAAVMDFAAESDSETARWIAEQVRFPCSMVDSITPATDEALRERVTAAGGLYDAWPIQRERFTQWVIEDDFAAERPPLEIAGVRFTADVGAFEAAKLRLLNGAHSTLAYLGLLLGHDTVAQAMRDDRLATFVERMMREDVAPSLVAPRGLPLDAYITAILERFANPSIEHRLAQIAWDGSQKLPYRLLDTVRDAIAQGRGTRRLAGPIAAWLRFIAIAARDGTPLTDPLADRLLATVADPMAILRIEGVFGRLSGEQHFAAQVQTAFDAMSDAASVRRSLD